MRTAVDLPDPLLRQLKSRAALEGMTLKQVIRIAIERGLGAEPFADSTHARSALPCMELGQPLRLRRLSNAALSELLDE